MEGFGIDKLLITLLIVLVMFGAKRIPEIGGSIGKGIREFKRGMSDLGGDSSPQPESQPQPRQLASPDSTERPAEPLREPKRLLM